MSRDERRLRRQIEALSESVPGMRRPVRWLIDRDLRLVRIPLGVLLVLFGLIGFLPVLGFWMLPLGLLVLAVDLPALRPFVSAVAIRTRRYLRRWTRRREGR